MEKLRREIYIGELLKYIKKHKSVKTTDHLEKSNFSTFDVRYVEDENRFFLSEETGWLDIGELDQVE